MMWVLDQPFTVQVVAVVSIAKVRRGEVSRFTECPTTDYQKDKDSPIKSGPKKHMLMFKALSSSFSPASSSEE